MIINNIQTNTTCEEIIEKLQKQLEINNIPLLQKVKDSGNNIMVQCPYHGNGQERRPSAGIRKSDGVFHCFACGESHTLPEVISHCFGRDDLGIYGNKWLDKNFIFTEVETRQPIQLDYSRNKPVIMNKAVSFVTEEELDNYRYYHKYWGQRGITDESIIDLFDLGYDKETQSITFPVRDTNGKCLFVARRSIHTKWFNYPKDVDKPLYGLYELTDKIRVKDTFDRLNPDVNGVVAYPDKLYITESMIDCLLLWQAGKYAVALNGTGSAIQLDTLRKLPIRHYVLATDNDIAGLDARLKLRDKLTNKILTEVNFPDNIKDIGECTKEQIQLIERWEVF